MYDPNMLRQAIMAHAQQAVMGQQAPGVPPAQGFGQGQGMGQQRGRHFTGVPYGNAYGFNQQRPPAVQGAVGVQPPNPGPGSMSPEPPPVLGGDPVLAMLRRMRGF